MSENKKDNYHSEWDGDTDQQVLDHLFYNKIMYLPLEEIDRINGSDIKKIISDAESMELTSDQQDILKEIKNIIAENPEEGYERVVIDSYSGTLGYDPAAISAAVFKKDGENSVVYRGTPGGAWVDNSDTLNGTEKTKYTDMNQESWSYLSDIDIQSLKYFEQVQGDYEKGSLYVAGHSKGGHEAMVVSLIYPEYIRSCYALDGQGIPPETWKELERLYGREKLDEIRNNIYGINVNNDYVHVLGWSEEYGYVPGHIYVIEGSEICSENPAANHYIQAFITNGNLNAIDPNGEGPLSKFLMAVSDRIMKLDPEDRKMVTDSIMIICQKFLGGQEPVGLTKEEVDDIWKKCLSGTGEAFDIIKEVLADPQINDDLVEYLKGFSMNGLLKSVVIKWIQSKKVEDIDKDTLKSDQKDITVTISEVLSDYWAKVSKRIDWMGDVFKTGLSHISAAGHSAIKRLGEFSAKISQYMAGAASEIGGFIKKIQDEVRFALDNPVKYLGEKRRGWTSKLDQMARGLEQVFNGIHNEIAEKGKALHQRIYGAQEDRKRLYTYFEQAAKGMVLDMSTGNPFAEQVIEQAKKTLDWVKRAEDTMLSSVQQMRDAAKNGSVLLGESLKEFNGWLEEPISTVSAQAYSSWRSDFYGLSGINYSALSQVQVLIAQYSDSAKEIEYQLNDVIEDLYRLRYASMGTGSFENTKRMVERQRNVMEEHSEQLDLYKRMCEEAEEGFIRAMSVGIV